MHPQVLRNPLPIKYRQVFREWSESVGSEIAGGSDGAGYPFVIPTWAGFRLGGSGCYSNNKDYAKYSRFKM